MTTMAKRKRSRKPKAEMQADDESRILREMAETKRGYEIPASLRKPDPIQPMCDDVSTRAVLFAFTVICFCAGLGLGWVVWA